MHQLYPAHVSEYNQVTLSESLLEIGSAANLTFIENVLKQGRTKLKKETSKHQVVQAILDQLHWFAGTPIRNTASVGGNVMNASPISDLIPVFLATRASFVLECKNSSRVVPADQFFLGYKKVDAKENELLASIRKLNLKQI